MKKNNTEKYNEVKVGNVPFKEVVGGFLKVKPPKEKKLRKSKSIDKKD